MKVQYVFSCRLKLNSLTWGQAFSHGKCFFLYKCRRRIKSERVNIEMKAFRQCFLVILFVLHFKVVLTFESVNEILNGNYNSNKSI